MGFQFLEGEGKSNIEVLAVYYSVKSETSAKFVHFSRIYLKYAFWFNQQLFKMQILAIMKNHNGRRTKH